LSMKSLCRRWPDVFQASEHNYLQQTEAWISCGETQSLRSPKPVATEFAVPPTATPAQSTNLRSELQGTGQDIA
jgi:hypothetical protein